MYCKCVSFGYLYIIHLIKYILIKCLHVTNCSLINIKYKKSYGIFKKSVFYYKATVKC